MPATILNYNQTMFWHWGTIYDVVGIPKYVADNQEISWGSSQVPTLHLNTSNFYEVINASLARTPPACEIGIKQKITGSTMTVKTKTVFFKEITGKLSLAIYITEYGFVHEQEYNEENIHAHVFRASLTDPQGKIWC